MDKEIALLKKCLETRSPILLVGAGFSLGAKSRKNHSLILGRELCAKRYEKVILPNKEFVSEEALEDAKIANNRGRLKELCTIIRDNNLISARNAVLHDFFSGCTYDNAEYYSYLTDYNWSYIFTLNIDDLIEKIYSTQGYSLVSWKLSSDRYTEDSSKTVLAKLHGDVDDPNTYVFDEKEYEKFRDSDCWMLRKFSDLYVCNDVIVLGTQFQEDDIKIALDKVFNYGCDNSNYHFFFISPGSYRNPVKDYIAKESNFHHIQWDTETFLNFIHNDISIPQNAFHTLRAQGVVHWNQEINDAKAYKEDWDLYHGRLSQPSDFYYSVDIPHTQKQDEIAEFLDTNEFGYVEIKGKPYTGKTCLVKRILTIGVEKQMSAFYCSNTDLHSIEAIDSFLEVLGSDDSVVICLENSASLYRSIASLVENHKVRLKKLIIITTSNDTTRESENYVFGNAPLLGLTVNERIDSSLAESIYNKLEEKAQLGKLLNYAERRNDIVKYIRKIDDLIDVLYVAHHGVRFSNYFGRWLQEKEHDLQLPVFQAFALLASMGVSNIMINKFPEISSSVGYLGFNYKKFIETFGEFCYENSGRLSLRCSRLFSDVLLKQLSAEKRKRFIMDLSYTLSRNIKENDHTIDSEIFMHITRASSLKKVVDLTDKDALDMLLELKDACKHLSYYWVQLGILYRNIKKFEDAQNSFEYAKRAHGKDSYQISHAMAKNYMEWGLWALKSEPTQSSHLFEEGAGAIIQLMWQWKYADAICFSAQAYIDMNIKYYTQNGYTPSKDTWSAMINCMKQFVYNASSVDRLLKTTFENMCRFARNKGLLFEEEIELGQEIKCKKLGETTNGEIYDIDVLPVYDN